MTVQRLCSKTACGRAASGTLTYNYAESTIVLGPLATNAEPHSYDLCADHANRLTAPRGWEVVRLSAEFEVPPPAPDDLVALADAVRAPSTTAAPAPDPRAVIADATAAELLSRIRTPGRSVGSVAVGRAGHLSVVPRGDDADDVDETGDPTGSADSTGARGARPGDEGRA